MFRTIIRQTFFELLVQPSVLFIFIGESAFIILLVFGINFTFDRGQLVSISLLKGKIDGEEIAYLSRVLVESTAGLLSSIMIFLFLIGTIYFFMELIKSPLVGIILTKQISRTKLFYSYYAGILFLFLTNVLVFSSVVVLILYAKCDGTIFISILSSSLLLFMQFASIFSLCALCATVIENVTGVTIIGLSFYFVFSPFLTHASDNGNVIAAWVSNMFPPSGEVQRLLAKHILGESITLFLWLKLIITTTVYLLIGARIFSKREFV